MKKVLKLVFKDSEYKTGTITIQDPKPDLAKETVQAAMEKIAATGAFGKAGVTFYSIVDSAKYYTTQSDELFDLDINAEEKAAA